MLLHLYLSVVQSFCLRMFGRNQSSARLLTFVFRSRRSTTWRVRWGWSVSGGSWETLASEGRVESSHREVGPIPTPQTLIFLLRGRILSMVSQTKYNLKHSLVGGKSSHIFHTWIWWFWKVYQKCLTFLLNHGLVKVFAAGHEASYQNIMTLSTNTSLNSGSEFIDFFLMLHWFYCITFFFLSWFILL